MGSFTDEMINLGLGNLIDKYVDDVILTDDVYLAETKTAANYFDELDNSDLSVTQKKLLRKFEEHTNAANSRVRDIAYLVGIRNMAIFMNELTPADCSKIILDRRDAKDDKL